MGFERKRHEYGAQRHKTSGHIQGTANILYAWRDKWMWEGPQIQDDSR